MNTISQQIDDFIAANGGNTRDALNIALARLEQAELRIRQMEEDKFLSNKEYKEIMGVPHYNIKFAKNEDIKTQFVNQFNQK